MQGKSEPSIKFPVIVNDCVDNASKERCQCRHHSRSVLRGPAMKRHHKFLGASKKPFWFTRRRSKIKLPTQFLLGGTINDPLNLEGLQKESNSQSDVHSFEMNSRVLTPKRLHRIGFPKITDTSDPLNLKNVSSKEQESLSDDCVTSVEQRQNACSNNHCQGVLVSEDNSEQRCQCFQSSLRMKERVCSCNSSFTLNNGYLHDVEVPSCSLNDWKTNDVDDDVAAVKVTDRFSDENISSIFSEVKAVASTRKKRFTSHERIVSPAIPQFSHRRARKRQQRSSYTSKEIVTSASTSHESSCKKIKEKFPCGNYVAYYGYRNVGRVEDPRLKLLPKVSFEGKDVLDIGCNAGLVTIAIASNYLPKRILGIDVDQRLIGLAKRNVRRYMDEKSYPSCLKTAFGPIAAGVLPSTECSAFPHNILFQVVKFLSFVL